MMSSVSGSKIHPGKNYQVWPARNVLTVLLGGKSREGGGSGLALRSTLRFSYMCEQAHVYLRSSAEAPLSYTPPLSEWPLLGCLPHPVCFHETPANRESHQRPSLLSQPTPDYPAYGL